MVLNDENYYSIEANKEYMSVSQYKDFMKCEAMALAKNNGIYKQQITKPLLVGSFVDSYFEGTLPKFINDNPDVFTRKNELRSEFKKANEIIGRVKTDPLFMRFMSGEKQKILTFELFGVMWKMKMDSYLKGICITDLKIVANFKTLPLWRYDIQGAIYQSGVEIITSEKLPFYLAVATKERVTDLDIFQIPQSTLELALIEVKENISHFNNVKSGIIEPNYCGHCDYCKSVKAATIRNYNELITEG
jgi:hypothetical protein